MKANCDIRKALQISGVFQWELAERMKTSEGTLCRRLRRELCPDEKSKMFAIIDEIQGERAAGA